MKWLDCEIFVLKENRKLSHEEIAKILPNRSPEAIKQKRTHLHLTREPRFFCKSDNPSWKGFKDISGTMWSSISFMPNPGI